METRTINVRQSWGTTAHTLEKVAAGLFCCPECGDTSSQWIDRSSDDYYDGCTCFCLECGTAFAEPSIYGESAQAEQIVAELRGKVEPQEVILPKPSTSPRPDYEKIIREAFVPGLQASLDHSTVLLKKLEKKG